MISIWSSRYATRR